ncbi:MAG: hypothetical protein L6Q40_11695 [Azonexus sp.]|nr:hypothetical protein [Azonexus sp.]
MKPRDLMHEFAAAAAQGPRIYFAPLFGAIRAVKDEFCATGTGRASIKTSVEFSVTPARKRKR